MKIVWRPTPNHWTSSEKKTAIILHKGLGSMAGDLSWINNPASLVSYSHYFPRKGKIVYQLVANNHSSWSSGHIRYSPTELGKTILQKDPSGKREYLNANRYVYNFGFQGKKSDTFTESQMQLAVWTAKKLESDLIIATHKDLVLYKPVMDEYRKEMIKRLDGITEHISTRPSNKKTFINSLIIRLLKLQVQVLMLQLDKFRKKGRMR